MANVPGIPVWRQMTPSPLPKGRTAAHAKVVIVGAGPVGLTLALDLAQRGHEVVVLNRLDFISAGSKAICLAKRTLDIWDRLGVRDAMVERGVIWDTGKVFWGDRDDPIYQFDLLPTKDQRNPAFINLQQYHAENILVDAAQGMENIDLRWGHAVTDVRQIDDHVSIDVSAADGSYALHCDWLIACDGFRSTIRTALALDFDGRIFEDNFLIADIKMKGKRPSERWFWFDPPFNRHQSALLHKQPDDIWRLDFQLGWDIDREAAIRPENVEPLVRGMLGKDIEFTPEWYSIYTFQCRRMARFVHGRVIFAGDAAHLVSPFGARGCNGGIADIDNLAWKLDAVLTGVADAALLESYNEEAITIADENILNSSRSTDFMTPKSKMSRIFRDSVLALAEHAPFARPFVNSGRLSSAVSFPASNLLTLDGAGEKWAGVAPGSPALDAPFEDGWFLKGLLSSGHFVLLANGFEAEIKGNSAIKVVDLSKRQGTAKVQERYALEEGSAYLFRPDQYVAGRWRRPDSAAILRAHARSLGKSDNATYS
jgi:3-(3-hydroxy-phenyl)propionate hydroxylase